MNPFTAPDRVLISRQIAEFVYVSTLMRRIVPLGICPNGTIRYPI